MLNLNPQVSDFSLKDKKNLKWIYIGAGLVVLIVLGIIFFTFVKHFKTHPNSNVNTISDEELQKNMSRTRAGVTVNEISATTLEKNMSRVSTTSPNIIDDATLESNMSRTR